MKVNIHSTNRNLAGYLNIGPITSSKFFEDVCLVNVIEKIEEVILDHVLCFFDVEQVAKIFVRIFERLEPQGTITVNCADIYNLAQALHRRTINEVDFNNLVLRPEAKNCYGPMFAIELARPTGLVVEECVFDDYQARVVFKRPS
jgi:hypothetical protein